MIIEFTQVFIIEITWIFMKMCWLDSYGREKRKRERKKRMERDVGLIE